MFPWTPPSTSWPTSAPPPTTTSPWPSNPPTMTTPTRPPRPPMSWPPTMPTSHPLPPHELPIEQSHYPVNHSPMQGATSPSVEHFFGHPSTLHPSLASTTSQPSTTHSTPTTFTTLATAARNLPAHVFSSTSTTSSPDPSIFHTAPPTLGTHVSQPTPPTWTTLHGPVSEQSISPTTSSPPVLPHQPPPLRVHKPKQTTSSPPTSTPRLTAVKAAPKLRPDKKTDKSRRTPPPVPTAPTFEPASTSPPSTSVQQDLATLGTTTQHLAESVRLLHAQQQQLLQESQRLHEQQQLTRTAPPPTTSPTPPTTTHPPPPSPQLAPNTRPREASASDPTGPPPSNPPIRIPSASPMRRPISRPRRSRSLRPSRDEHRRHSPRHRPQRPRSPLPRYRSSTMNPKDRRTPSPYRRRSPPRHRSAHQRRSPEPHRHGRSDHTQSSRTPPRPPRGAEVVLTPASPLDPGFIPTPDADDTWGNWYDSHQSAEHPREARPRSPPNPPPSTTATGAPVGAVSFRIASGDSENSEQDEPFSFSNYETSDIDIDEMKAAAEDPNRTRCVTELGSSHVVHLRTELDHPTKILFNNFIDEMFNQLAKPYTTSNNELIFIKASRVTVTNIARAFAQAQLRRTQGFYVEPENLLTITVPTGLPQKELHHGEHAGTYMSYHKTSWDSVAKILVTSDYFNLQEPKKNWRAFGVGWGRSHFMCGNLRHQDVTGANF